MKLWIISGTSGAGKSIALHALEDLDFYCIDNLPLALLPAFANELLHSSERHYDAAAVGIDARTATSDLRQFPRLLNTLRECGSEPLTLFLNADDQTLVRRFKETRRRHPLQDEQQSLIEAIRQERLLLEPIAQRADITIDTTRSNVHQLRGRIQEQIGAHQPGTLSLLIQSFGYKQGIPIDADFVFDVRCLPNPYWEPALRDHTGRDPEVATFLERDPELEPMFGQVRDLLAHWLPRFQRDNRASVTIAIGCTGGQHRSVYFSERLARHFRDAGYPTLARHRELN